VSLSAVGDTENDPALLLIEKVPRIAEKSVSVVVKFFTVQYNVVPLGTLVVLTPNVPELPSLMLVGMVPKLYVTAGA
jgi:hypothetical protein